jgi:uncharacterized membrane protein (UPF0127 family)
VILCLSCRSAPEELPPRKDPSTSAQPVAPRNVPPVTDPPSSSVPSAPQNRCPKDPDGAPPMLPTYPLKFSGGAELSAVEFVVREQDTERGLMFRTQMPEDHGMLFKLTRKVQTFWMHNTCIPLDMLFVEDDGTVVGILENVPILNDEGRSVGKPSVYVLETNAGWCARHGAKVGQKIALPESVRTTKPHE